MKLLVNNKIEFKDYVNLATTLLGKNEGVMSGLHVTCMSNAKTVAITIFDGLAFNVYSQKIRKSQWTAHAV